MAGPPNQRLLDAPESPQPLQCFQEKVDIVQLPMAGQHRQRERSNCLFWQREKRNKHLDIFPVYQSRCWIFLFHFIFFFTVPHCD